MTTTWRLIDSGPTDAYLNMAIDEAIAIAVRDGKAPPTLRFYEWLTPSITIGCYQKTEDVNTDYCNKHNIPLVRRPTGGRAILHGYDLTYSFASRNTPPYFSEGLLKTYGHLSMAFLMALKRLGFEATMKNRKEKGSVLTGSALCFQSVSFGEITIKNRKVVGSAQKRWPDGFLQQGSILLRLDKEAMTHVFKKSHRDTISRNMTGLYEHMPSLDVDDFKKEIRTAFEEAFSVDIEIDCLTEEEKRLATELRDKKYSQLEWILSR